MKKHIYLLLLILAAVSLSALEISGHISEDTIWSPENNPYVVTTFLYIDTGVTLSILPGTEVLIMGADKNDANNFIWIAGNEPHSKMIVVDGRIHAEGTAEQPIVFDKYQDSADYRWGGIYMSDTAPASTFHHCEFSHTNKCSRRHGDASIVTNNSLGALTFHNGVIKVRSCSFKNIFKGIITANLKADILIYDCKFYSINDTYPQAKSFIFVGPSHTNPPETNYEVTIANCRFIGNGAFGGGREVNVFYLNNYAESDCSELTIQTEDNEEKTDFPNRGWSISSYGNRYFGLREALMAHTATLTTSISADDIAFFRRNTIITPSERPLVVLSAGGYGTNYIADNYLSGHIQINVKSLRAEHYIYNNIIESRNEYNIDRTLKVSSFNNLGTTYFFNNLVRHIGESGQSYNSMIFLDTNSSYINLFNNTVLNFKNFHDVSLGVHDIYYTNNIIDANPLRAGEPIFYNNLLNIELPPHVPGADNILGDPAFADTLNADYRLTADSPAVDAGRVLSYLPDFDLDYNHRISPSGLQRVDIGAYEYDSYYIGGIAGYVYDADSGLPVDCAKLEIEGFLPEYSDSLGCFPYPTGAGVYEVKASRWDYPDVIIGNVVVIDGEDTILNIPLRHLEVSNDDPVLSPIPADLALRNYPNPFNPETTISFIAPAADILELSIFNIRGQKIRTLHQGMIKEGHHQFVWDGKDEQGNISSSGLYFARLVMPGMRQNHKMILLK